MLRYYGKFSVAQNSNMLELLFPATVTSRIMYRKAYC